MSDKKLKTGREIWADATLRPGTDKPQEKSGRTVVMAQKLTWFDNLLCTIHRDGGHFIEDNGYEAAYNKAMDKVIKWVYSESSKE